MPKKFKKKEILPDPKYNDILVAKFINHVMKKGKKFLARKIVYSSFEIVKKETKEDPLEIFKKAIESIAPTVEVRPRRVGGATYQVPVEVKGNRRISLAIRWLLSVARKKKGKPMEAKLAQEIILASKNEGEAVRKKVNTHKMAEANKAFAYLAK